MAEIFNQNGFCPSLFLILEHARWAVSVDVIVVCKRSLNLPEKSIFSIYDDCS